MKSMICLFVQRLQCLFVSNGLGASALVVAEISGKPPVDRLGLRVGRPWQRSR